MNTENIGALISKLRKEKGMTQQELADKLKITDKAVSKWERDLSFPDVNSLPKLAEIFNVSIDELMQVKEEMRENTDDNHKGSEIVNIALKGIALAMGIAVVVLSFINELETRSAVSMLGIGLACLALVQFSQKNDI